MTLLISQECVVSVMFRFASVLVFWGALAQAAFATPEDYCAAYARDFADAGLASPEIWQQRYDNASSVCMYQFTPQTNIVAKPQKSEPKLQPRVKAKIIVAAKPKPMERLTEPDALVEPVANTPVAKLEPGSAEWLDYCARKYVSFSREKGTYVGKSGAERKCLVTADFK